MASSEYIPKIITRLITLIIVLTIVLTILSATTQGAFKTVAQTDVGINEYVIALETSQDGLIKSDALTASHVAKNFQIIGADKPGKNLLETSNIATLVQTIDVSAFEPPSPDTAGIAYIDSSNTLLFSDSEVNEMPIFNGDNLFEIETNGNLITTTTTTSFTNEPTGVAYNPDNNHVFISDDDRREIYEIEAGLDNLFGTVDDHVASFDTTVFNAIDPEGITYDTLQGVLYIVDGFNSDVFRISPGSNGIFDGVPSAGDDQVSSFDTASWGINDPEGITYNTTNGNLYVIGKPGIHLAEFNINGVLERLFDISAANAIKPAGLAYGPGSQNPNQMSVYITDRGIDNNNNPDENDGKIYEMVLPSTTPGNQPPDVDAGSTQTITLPDAAALVGSTTDDGSPDPPSSVSVTWIQVSGPGTVTYTNPNNVNTTASFSTYGEYVLRLIANDGELIGSDEVTITVNPPPNAAPTVEAGDDQVITLPENAELDATVTDEGLPDPPGLVITNWSKVSGPGTVTFDNASDIDTTATFNVDGLYELRLTADDGEFTSSDEVYIWVDHPNPNPNQAPIVDAGPEQTIALTNTASLNGTVTDDGLPYGNIDITWKKVQGPGQVVFGDFKQVDTTASFPKEGVYTLSLAADDGDLRSSDEVTITVNSMRQLWLPITLK